MAVKWDVSTAKIFRLISSSSSAPASQSGGMWWIESNARGDGRRGSQRSSVMPSVLLKPLTARNRPGSAVRISGGSSIEA
jgi:hypothetical protein